MNKKVILLGLIVVAIAIFVVIRMNYEPKAISGPIPTIETAETSQESPDTEKRVDTTPPDKSTVGSTQTESTGELIAPYGSLVSNHRPGQNGSNLIESSQCVTNPGAKCYLKFTQGDVVKTLPEKTADSSGSVFWDWDVKEAGLTSGKWTVTAVATKGSKTKTTVDQVALEVQ